MTTRFLFSIFVVAASTIAVPLAAQAQQAVAAKSVNVRAGPGRDYPLVVTVGAGAPLAVQGCLDNYSWCDVVVPGNNRGWIYAGNISYPYQSSAVPVLEYGAAIGLPVISFVFGSYWGDYYRNRPFYRDRERWANHSIPHGPAFRPGYRPGPGMNPRPGFGHGPAVEHRPGMSHEVGGGRPGPAVGERPRPGGVPGGGMRPGAESVPNRGGPAPARVEARPAAPAPRGGGEAPGRGDGGGRREGGGGGERGGGERGGGGHGGEHGR